jgi:23S rRNA (cytidine1920-2'-O)/16S rRNA (cytidine1409-2'-O)-methyltransferase
MRLDQLLAESGLAPSRARAADLIRRGAVTVDGATATKPGQSVSHAANIVIAPEGGAQYVSRSALKLAAALDAFAFSPVGKTALDIGASTGGFTEVLLERGAARVYAVDVGHEQLHNRLRQDARVVNLDNTDARILDNSAIPEPIDALVIDVSFVSLLKILPYAFPFAAGAAWLVALVKPQFEVGRAFIGKGGVVKDDSASQRALEDVRAFIAAQPGWEIAGIKASPIKGQDGNQEHLIGARYAL